MLNSWNILEHQTHIIHEMFMNIHEVRFKLMYISKSFPTII